MVSYNPHCNMVAQRTLLHLRIEIHILTPNQTCLISHLRAYFISFIDYQIASLFSCLLKSRRVVKPAECRLLAKTWRHMSYLINDLYINFFMAILGDYTSV